MYLVLEPEQVKAQYILTHAPVRNTVMHDSDFIRLLYSDGVIALNGLHVRARLRALRVEQYFNKFRCTLDIARSAREVQTISSLEQMVLEQAGIRNKRAVKRITEQLQQGSFKLFSESARSRHRSGSPVFVLKMSGIWETAEEYGVTYKFMEVHP
tara:strand:+ start:282 stop:746 length:465 start_codon:yes stop_codon:yes gene_type:complete